ncbi:MAG: helix-hairpin-helix domain-containing protein [Planctomycetota bacterium]|jgi:competence protein ComEA|nr:competence protein [Deltaproteobacteria bacterium]MDP6540106.1 helix-hairpin-helix domain-containing protein [Planctomycetota bacterium]
MNLRTTRTRLVRRAILAIALAASLSSPTWAGAPALQGTLNLNQATVEQLVLLPGVGESRARAIVAFRKQRGPFKAVAELVEVKGIGEAALAKLKPYLRLAGKTTLRVD